MDPIVAILSGNAVALIVGFFALVRWFRRWLIKQVSEPIELLQRTVEIAHQRAESAHDRLDRHLEAHSNG